MTDDLKERLLSWQPGQDEEALREEALARITDLEEVRDSWMRACNLALQEKLVVEARLAAAETEAGERHELHLEQARITNEWIARADAAKAENTQLKRQVETLKTGWEIADRDRIKAEAGEDALAEGARIGLDSFKDHPFILNDKEQATVERITAALAAYEARRKG